ncbi:MAG TPA: RES domain-containing protein [Candidatus Baltobacteraceae bacterium]|nr:RES domain-containing protein [Candidatus Baltobacteraceae bacterium]
MTFVLPSPPRLYRVNFGPNVRLRDWSAARVKDRLGLLTFGHRWDDPQRKFRSLYLGDSDTGAMVEVLQDLMPHPVTVQRARALVLEPGEEPPPVGSIDPQFFEDNYLCTLSAEANGHFIDVLNADIIKIMNDQHGALLHALHLPLITADTMNGYDTEVTQAVARTVYEGNYDGIMCMSKFGMPHVNWTIFETGFETHGLRHSVELAAPAEQLSATHPAVTQALATFGVQIDPADGMLYPLSGASLPPIK